MRLSSISLALNRPGAVATLEQQVASLFANNEQGAWYDPSAANVTWRRNLLTRTEEFNDSAWLKANLTATANATTAPDSTSTADKLIAAVGAGGLLQHFAYVNFPLLVAGTDYVFSVYLKAAEYTWAVVYVGGTAKGRYINLVTGDVGNSFIGAPTSTTVTDAGNGWWKVSMLVNMVTATSGDVRVYLAPSNGSTNSVGDDTSGLFAWGAQFERSSSATAYQRIVTPEITYLADVQSQPLLWQDFSGVPVSGVEQPVAIVFDRKRPLVAGPELGNVTPTAYANSTVSVVGSTITCTCTSNGSYGFSLGSITTTGKWYRMSFTISTNSANRTIYAWPGLSGLSATFSGTGDKLGFCLNNAGGSTVVAILGAVAGESFSITNISVRLFDGNHAYQTGSAARPVLRARYNLLTYSEQFDQGVWSKGAINTTGSPAWINTAVAPDGTSTADLVIPTNASAVHQVSTNSAVTVAGSNTLSVYAKAGGYQYVQLMWGSGSDYANFYLSGAGSVSQSSGGSASIQSVGNGWYRCSFTSTLASSVAVYFLPIQTGTEARFATTTGDGTSGIYLWGADLRVGTSAGDYQRIAAATDYATTSTITGQPFRPYLWFSAADGTGDSLVTASVDFSASDEMTVCSALAKQVNTGIGILVELSAIVDTNAGSFYIGAPENAIEYTTISRGSASLNANQAANVDDSQWSGPATQLLSYQTDISADSGILRLNKTQAAVSTGDRGTGNFGNYPIYIGRRGGNTYQLNAYVFGMIIRGKSCTAGELAALEDYMAGKAGLTL